MHKVLVANRGEIALRVIRACHELRLAAVAVYSTADQDALHVRRADEAICIGPPHARDSYLNITAVLQAARQSGADAVHPGYGFLAENPRFAAACRDEGLVFVGPSPEAIEAMGDKAEARRLAERAGVPTVPGTDGTVSLEQALAVAAEIGYPVMVKAAAGGGGRGIRAAHDEAELGELIVQAGMEAEAAFGDGALYLEKLLVDARHVEVQVLGDSHGTLVHLFERECSLQRRRQKLFEEAPSPALDADTRQAMADAALRLARAAGYENAGTVEFLLDRDGAFYFIEMNTRIQVEHPVTEQVTGVDLVKEQLRIARGERLSFHQEELELEGTAFELRINAEDPERNFLPSPGEITALELPGGPGVRVDTAAFAGYHVPPFYDSLLAKLVCAGRDREEALARAERALGEFRIEGVKTTIPFHLELLADEAVRAGDYHVEFLERRAAGSGRMPA
ncbi:MAG TPA: acetyl-CoA carboxylase biotin carboxylase subunit [Gaiellaceae bacterium]|nr:acetyl-CoA carboxylase biotin carboxylase subunit [Gaiellaceae bacterium]